MDTDRHPTAERRPEAGFSLIEVLIASMLLLFIVIGVLPLFSRSMMNNIQGNDASNFANSAVEGFESMFSLPFNNDLISLPAGQTLIERRQFFTLHGNQWLAAVPAGDEAQYERLFRLQQFSFADISEDGDFDTPLDGGAEPGNIQFKAFELEITNNRMVGAPPYRVRALQSF